MDRVNRSLFVASTLLAVPVALLMASLTTGTTPDVQLAVGQDTENAGSIQQVAGSHQHHQHGNQHSQGHHSQAEPKGLLDAFFDRSKSRQHSTHHSGSKSHGKTSGSGVNWDGIPFHRAHTTSRSSSSATPIRDPRTPSTASTSGGATRIIRGGSSRSVQAKPASVRRPPEPTLARQPARPLSTPTKVAPIRSSVTSLSTSSSSRRSSRRSVDAIDASQVVSSKPSSPSSDSSDNVDDLIPRVVRERAEKVAPKSKDAATAKAKVAKTDTKVAAAEEVTKPEQEAKAEQLVQSKTKPEKEPTPTASPAKQPDPQTALAAIGQPTPTMDSNEEPESAGAVTDATLKVRPAVTTPSNPAYTTPVDPATSPIPVAGIPTHPYAASTPAPVPETSQSIPASPASHRAGPPSGAFATGQIAAAPSHPHGRYVAQPQFAPYGQPQFNAASTPVGSGVVGNGDVASYRRPPQPVLETANRPSYPSVDPYASGPASQGGRMTTYGQVVTGPTNMESTTPAPLTAPIPMQPITGYAPRRPAGVGMDNFAASNYSTRNQMRDSIASTGNLPPGATAASSELPGIRVVTHGPSSIMVRQTNQYEIRVENRGAIDATGVMVRAAVPDWADLRGQNATRGDVDSQRQGSTERLVWTIDHLPAGAAEQMFVRLTAERSGTYDLDVDWTLIPQKSVAKVQVREPRLDLTIEGPDEVVYGQSQTYKVRVLNPGDGTAPNVVFTLSPNSATPQTQRIGDIPPGKEAQFDVELTAQDLGDLKIHGLAAGELELRAEASKTIRVAAAKLEAVLTGPELKYQNTEAMYSLQVHNGGAATSEKIIATLRIPSGVKYLGGIEEAAVQGNALKWEITALAPGATRNYQFRCNMATTGEHLLAFDCKGTAAGHTDVSIATQVESIADLVLSVSDPAAPAPIGSDVTYEIVIRNRGSKEAVDVRAVAQFSHGIEPQRIEGQSGEVVTGQVLFDPIPRIGAGQEVRMRVIAQADQPGHHRFRTEVRSGDTVLVAEEATHYMSPKSDRVSRRSSDSGSR